MLEKKFKLTTKLKPTGDQPAAIKQLVKACRAGERYQTLLGATGTGKTFVMANVIAQLQKPALIIAHNKTLAAQLCSEFKELFGGNAVNYFISYYDYYQPEAYIPTTDTYIAKDASINEEIDKFRHAATRDLLTRQDVIIVASVSCIYGLGSAEEYGNIAVSLAVGQQYKRDKLLRHLTDIQYQRNEMDFARGHFRVRGEVVEIFPSYADTAFRLVLINDVIEEIWELDPLTGEMISKHQQIKIYPAKHAVTTKAKIERAVEQIREELSQRLAQLAKLDKKVEAHRLQQRTEYDIEMMLETGYCNGIENYARYLTSREQGEEPATLLDYFPDDFLLFIDESHMTVPQIGGMYAGDRSRKETLVEHGFRLPSALDNRPLTFEEFEKHINKVVFVSATPRDFELRLSGKPVEQIIRPTGLVDPQVEVRPTENQIDDLLAEIHQTVAAGERVLVTTLTKRMSEDLTEYLNEVGVKVRYLHSDIDTLQRIEIIRDLRKGEFDVLVGINLLREGLDLPEVSLITILDADKEGFLRSDIALIQTIGRCARNVHGHVIMYADRITNSMQRALDETERRRKIQVAHNKKHGITPQTIVKEIKDIVGERKKGKLKEVDLAAVPVDELQRMIKDLEVEMDAAAANLEFEKAAELRDQIVYLESSGKNIKQC